MADISKLEQQNVYIEFSEEQMKNIEEMRKIISEHESKMNKLIAESERKEYKKAFGRWLNG